MKIGKIVSVDFDKFRVKLFHTTKTSTISIEGKVYYFGNIGSYLKVENSIGDTIICEVVSILDNNNDSKPFTDYNLDSSRELIIKPLGTLKKDRKFTMGVGIFPSIYSDIMIVTENDIRDILVVNDKQSLIEEGSSIVHSYINIGESKSLINYQVQLSINSLFNIHTAVLGNSGSGKSNTISHIIQEIFRKESNSGLGIKTIVFDVNGEYKSAFINLEQNGIKTKFYKPNKLSNSDSLHLPYYLMNIDEWSAFLMATDRTQKPFWDKVLQECYKFYKINTGNILEQQKFINYFRFKLFNILNFIFSRVDSDTANVTSAASAIRKIKDILISKFNSTEYIKDFLEDIDEILKHCVLNYGVSDKNLLDKIKFFSDKIDYQLALDVEETKLSQGNFYDYEFLKVASEIVLLEENAKGNSRIYDNTATMLSRLDYFLNNSECEFMKNTNVIYKSELDYLNKVFGIYKKNINKNQLVIIDLSEVTKDILELISSVINRIIFDFRKKLDGEKRRKDPIHIILDEAHRYIKKDSDYLMKENIFEKIAREGRKYSLYLIVSSQRPSELSQTVLSQCGNYIIHRIQNEIDMNYIYSVLPYFSLDYISKIKQSIPGEALIFGNCVPMPLHVKILKANPAPDSENCIINEEWYIEIESDTLKN